MHAQSQIDPAHLHANPPAALFLIQHALQSAMLTTHLRYLLIVACLVHAVSPKKAPAWRGWQRRLRTRRLGLGSTCTESGPACGEGLECVCAEPEGRRLFGAPAADTPVCNCATAPSPPRAPPPSPRAPPTSPPASPPAPPKGAVRNTGGAPVTSGLTFFPEVWWEGTDSNYSPGWYPICGHYFWDDSAGATLACTALEGGSGCTSGSLSPASPAASYTTDAIYVGRCTGSDPNLYSCTGSGSYNSWDNLHGPDGKCKAGMGGGSGNRIKVTCNAGCTA